VSNVEQPIVINQWWVRFGNRRHRAVLVNLFLLCSQ